MANTKLPPPPPIHPLEEYRLSHDLSYRALKELIDRLVPQHPRSPDHWRQICKRIIPEPSERTEWTWKQFLSVAPTRNDAAPLIAFQPEPKPQLTAEQLRKQVYLSVDDLMVYLGLTRSQAYAFLKRNTRIRKFRAGGGYRLFRVDVDNAVDDMAKEQQKKARAS